MEENGIWILEGNNKEIKETYRGTCFYMMQEEEEAMMIVRTIKNNVIKEGGG
jgi:hypothetical protein